MLETGMHRAGGCRRSAAALAVALSGLALFALRPALAAEAGEGALVHILFNVLGVLIWVLFINEGSPERCCRRLS